MKIEGLSIPDNCTLKFNADGVIVRIDISIEKRIAKYASPNNVSFGRTCKYHIEKQIPSAKISAKNINCLCRLLIDRAKKNIDSYKKDLE